MTKKQKKMLYRILIAAVLFLAAKFIPMPMLVSTALYFAAYVTIGYDILRKAFKGICNHLPELLTLFGIGAGDAFVRIYPDELPIIPAIDVIRVVVNLRFVTGQLLLVVGADTSVGRHTSLLSAVDRCRRAA